MSVYLFTCILLLHDVVFTVTIKTFIHSFSVAVYISRVFFRILKTKEFFLDFPNILNKKSYIEIYLSFFSFTKFRFILFCLV